MFFYELQTASGQQALPNMTTNGTTNTLSPHAFIKPGATRPVNIAALRYQGMASAGSSLSGLSLRLLQWTTASATTVGGTSVTVRPKSALAPAAAASAGIASSAGGTITAGSGGGYYVGLLGGGTSGPGGWVSINPDDVPQLDGGTNGSMDLNSIAVATGLAFQFALDLTECG
jgi:hypothetical protein